MLDLLGSICLRRIFWRVSRGMELVAIRMSQTCVMPSTLVHCGVSSVMPWTMSTGPLAVTMVKMRRPNSLNG